MSEVMNGTVEKTDRGDDIDGVLPVDAPASVVRDLTIARIQREIAKTETDETLADSDRSRRLNELKEVMSYVPSAGSGGLMDNAVSYASKIRGFQGDALREVDDLKANKGRFQTQDEHDKAKSEARLKLDSLKGLGTFVPKIVESVDGSVISDAGLAKMPEEAPLPPPPALEPRQPTVETNELPPPPPLRPRESSLPPPPDFKPRSESEYTIPQDVTQKTSFADVVKRAANKMVNKNRDQE